MRTLAYKIIFINAFLRKGGRAKGWRKMESKRKKEEKGREGERERKQKTARESCSPNFNLRVLPLFLQMQ